MRKIAAFVIAIIAVASSLVGAQPKAIRWFPLVPKTVSDEAWSEMSPRLVKVFSGRRLAEGQELKARLREDGANAIFHKRLKADLALASGIVTACLKGGFTVGLRSRWDPNAQRNLQSAILSGSRISPIGLPEDLGALERSLSSKRYSGITHVWGRIALWHVETHGGKPIVELDGATSEDALNVMNTVISFVKFPASVNDNLHGGNSHGVPVLLTFRSTHMVAILYASGYPGGFSLRYSMNPVIVMDDHRPWTEPPYGQDAVEASDVFYDPSIGERGRFVYRNYGGTAKDLNDVNIKWEEGKRSAFAPIQFGSRESYGVMPLDTKPPRGTGSISGELSYPSEGIPSLRIVARNMATGDIYHVSSKANWGNGKRSDYIYTIGGLPAGRYTVICYERYAHPDDWATLKPQDCGAYTVSSATGFKNADHRLKPVVVAEGQKVVGVDPSDWMGVTGDIPPLPF
jgi:hypothetical protein